MLCTKCEGKLELAGKYYICNNCEISSIIYTNKDETIYVASRIPQIVKDFSAYQIGQKVREKAVEIYIQVIQNDTLKKDNRKAMMCVCAYEAYKRLGSLRDPIMLAKLFGVSKVSLRNAYDIFHAHVYEMNLIDTYPKRHLTAKELLPEFLELMEIEDPPLNELANIIDLLYNKNTMINRIAPRDIAIGVAFWYNSKMEDPLSKDTVKNMTDIKMSSFNTILQSIISAGC
jgi:transcription initiation factor TFIIIB Brf1 subunit/transcription initiation factor TFIIB